MDVTTVILRDWIILKNDQTELHRKSFYNDNHYCILDAISDQISFYLDYFSVLNSVLD